MNLSITIEVDDLAPKVELCGEKCKGLSKGICHLFGEKLDEDSTYRIDNFDGEKLTLENTLAFYKWKRCKKCIEGFYCFGDKTPNLKEDN